MSGNISNNIRSGGLLALLYALLFISPFLNFARYPPFQDWWSNALAVGGCGLASILLLSTRAELLAIPRVVLVLAALLLQWGYLSGLWYQNFLFAIPALGALFCMLFLSLFVSNAAHISRERWCALLAACLVLGASLQIILGAIQIVGLAPLFRGWVLFNMGSPTDLLGNVGQRNMYAEYVAWAIPAVCLLYARGALRMGFCFAVLLFLALFMTWTGARLVLAYGLAWACVAWFWYRRSPADPVLKRMLHAMLSAVILLVLLQVFNREIIAGLNHLGLHLQIQSGSDRLMDAGFGARRRIEWSKAWEVFLAHPWVGGGLGSYAAESVRLEAFGGLPKAPESWLFTHCHNLFFQLLAETGLSGALTVLVGLVWCLFPYMGRGRQTPENMMLISIAAAILIHSQFEFPLWYMPFLAMLTLICALSPAAALTLPFSRLLRNGLCLLAGSAMWAHVAGGAFLFPKLIRYNYPTRSIAENQQRIIFLEKAGLNPFWTAETNLMLANYLVPTREMLALELPRFEQFAKWQPYPSTLVKLSQLQALAHQPEAAQASLALAIASFPDYCPQFAAVLAASQEPEMKPLASLAGRSAQAYAAHGMSTDAGRVAAVMTVASPVTRKTLF